MPFSSSHQPDIRPFSAPGRSTGAVSALTAFLASFAASAVTERFPRPEFESGHEIPATTVPMPAGAGIHVLDVALLLVALSAASYFALKARSRKGVAATLIFSLLYFGFLRGGCVCSVGSIQNVSLALFNDTALSWVVFAFFALPIVFTLFFGRTFCGSVCPLGAIQDVFVIKPLKIPRWIDEALGTIPYLYLGIAVLFAATGTGFIICRTDLFVGFFRFSGPLPKIIAGAAVLAAGIFVARPYCRFLCPYGVLLRWASMLSWRRLVITSSDCVRCSLCVDACPFGAVDPPAPAKIAEPRRVGARRLAAVMACVPLALAAGAFAGHQAGPYLARVNPVVKRATALSIIDEEGARTAFPETSDEAKLLKRAAAVQKRMVFGSTLLGLFIGLVVGVKLTALSRRPSGDRYTPNRAKCLACARCVKACPVNSKRKA